MSWTFNPPPGWPPQPAGWVPPPGWAPDPSWPPAPAGWQFWVPAGSAPAATLPDATLAPASGPVAPASGPVDPFAPAPEPAGAFAPAPGPAGALPPTSAGLYRPGVAMAPVAGVAALPPASSPPAHATIASRPWFGRWWAIAGLVALLLVGSALGYGGTRVALELASDRDPPSTGDPGGGGDPSAQPSPPAGESPEPTAPPGPALPTLIPPVSGQICGEVAIIMLTMVTDPIQSDDFEEYLDAVVEARRTAAGELRTLAEEEADQQQRTALETFADEVDASAQMVEDNPDDQGSFEDSFDRVSDAYETFGDENC